MAPSPPEPVLRVIAALFREPQTLLAAKSSLAEQWGPIDFEGRDHPFDVTTYYEQEMGRNLVRRWLAFAVPMQPDALVAAKLHCMQLETQLADAGRRRINLDVGYFDRNKLVLASIKPAGQKLFLGQGVYGDLVAKYRGGRYLPFEWSFPDFKDQRYDDDFAAFRHIVLAWGSKQKTTPSNAEVTKEAEKS